MVRFSYRAFDSRGELRQGDVEAISRAEAEERLWRQGLTPFEWRLPSESISILLRLRRGARHPGAKRLAAFTREFATLEQADIPLDQSLRLLASETESSALRRIVEELLRQIVDGASLSQALAGHPEVFGEDYVQVVRQGESVGRVGAALGELAETLERRQELRGRVQSALVYPALLVVMAIGSVSVVLGTLIPNIAPIFTDNGRPLPSGLRLIMDVEAHGQEVGLVALAALIGLTGAARAIISRPALRIAFDRALLRLPALGPSLQKFAAARFARALGSTLKAGAPLLPAFDSARLSVNNAYLRGRLAHALDEVRSGARLSAALRDVELFPSVASQMVAIGEETGQSAAMLLRLATLFERDTQAAIERLMSLLTPLLTIVIAGLVGALILTVMDAVLSINDMALK
ncbi:type II secretion system protein F (GspF) [Rhodoblastus acidophilus]|uniref:Type II secretion system protein F (GspF) n=2 Tax=Rhodoblastus acidophilus TaxID=1074 RepID=A0A212SB05_RHOAC|nr:type II secretion protein F [Rhodoblastus acidophilus]RAI20000.1 type II secretion protein F [Rhodoblastus acidophilus]SNB82549.1 type II secretion system protein F (GspF) [Rhodoblastus acidophilus]